MQQGSEEQGALRTRVYIDGYNLYYGCLKQSFHKWLNPRALIECVLATILYERNGEPVRYRLQTPAIKYFTAPILEAFAKADDAIRKEVDQIIVLTNDTDFAPAMRMIREHTPVIVGLIAPIKAERGTVNAGIEKYAHWTRKHILDEEFARSQLPHMVRCKGSVIHKPITWYPRPDLLMPIYEEAKRVKRSAGAARKWLNQSCARLDDRVPIEMCCENEPAQELRAYMDSYAKEFGV